MFRAKKLVYKIAVDAVSFDNMTVADEQLAALIKSFEMMLANVHVICGNAFLKTSKVEGITEPCKFKNCAENKEK